MSHPSLGLLMLGLIVAAIMMGFPTAFTLMGLGMIFGYVAFYDPSLGLLDNRVFDLIVQRAYWVMTNDQLLSVPLFVLMGYVIERAALVDKMFYSVQLAFKRIPGSLAVTTLLVCAFWGIASGIVGAVVVLMGVIAMRPMMKAGYDVRLASGVITAGGTLGILIPPSVMIIVYAAVTAQSVVKLYAAAMIPGFFLTFLYLVYIIGWAMLNPKVAPRLSEEEYRIAVPDWIQRMEIGPARRVMPGLFATLLSPSRMRGAVDEKGQPVGYARVVQYTVGFLVPLVLVLATFLTAWWYVVIYSAPQAQPETAAAAQVGAPVQQKTTISGAPVPQKSAPGAAPAPPPLAEPPKEEETQPEALGEEEKTTEEPTKEGPLEELGGQKAEVDETAGKIPEGFFTWFWILLALSVAVTFVYYWRMDGEGLKILLLLEDSIVPLGVLTVVVLAVILLGITTATESAAVGAFGAMYLAAIAKYTKRTLLSSVVGGLIGIAFGTIRNDMATYVVAFSLGSMFAGVAVTWIWDFLTKRLLVQNIQESTFLTAKTTAMVCWLFVGSGIFSAVFALHGGQSLVEHWVLSMDLTPLQFMLLAQAIIFVLGWPLEWTEIIVIFVPIFVPMLTHFHIDPVLFGTMVAVNLQAAFLSPPVAMSAFYLKGVSPAHVTLNQIFAGMMPYMLIVMICLVIMYLWPGMTLWLPNFIYGSGGG
jgi:TRAP-type mannitol/chloroaromatic compound transport system permease large subunit